MTFPLSLFLRFFFNPSSSLDGAICPKRNVRRRYVHGVDPTTSLFGVRSSAGDLMIIHSLSSVGFLFSSFFGSSIHSFFEVDLGSAASACPVRRVSCQIARTSTTSISLFLWWRGWPSTH